MDLNEGLRKKAEAGDVDARYQLGINYLNLYEKGQNDERAQLFEEAIAHLKIASEQGAYDVCTVIACAYWGRSLEGKSGEDFQNAILWFHKGAEAGQSAAMEYLGDIHFLGIGSVQVDHGLAARWYEKAMQSDPREGSMGLGVCYDEGKGVPKDALRAESCFKVCSDPTRYLGWNYLGSMVAQNPWYSDGCADKTTIHRHLIEGARALGIIANTLFVNFYENDFDLRWAFEFKSVYDDSERDGFECSPGRALYNNGLAQYLVGQYQKAIVEWELSASHKFVRSEYSLGIAYMNGEGVDKDPVVGFSWLLRAAEQALPQAQARIGDAYLRGEGVGKSPVQAVSWYSRAAESGNVAALLALAECYETGTGVRGDRSLAFSLYQRAAFLGNPRALAQVSAFYEYGRGVPKNLTEALAFAILASEINNEALARLSDLLWHFQVDLEDRHKSSPGGLSDYNKHLKPIDDARHALAGGKALCASALERLRQKMNPSQISDGTRRLFELRPMIDKQRTP